MSTFITLIILVIISGGGMLYLVGNRFRTVRIIEEKELLVKLQSSKSLFADFYTYIIVPTVNFWSNSVLPNLYKESEKTVSRFRINVLRIEHWLLKLTNYIRGKRQVQNNGSQTEYWKDLNESKNGNGNGEKKPE